ncbi:hypothetical protein SLS60_007459 [Paraconiothyrium brasiliense]|uniref:Kelch repeat protein n=1 Tax=Paraconiothyrium brasiliense TaxID=300254 RepID=A0ABR3R5H3_9PLEO
MHLLWEDVLATDNETEFPQQYKNLTKTPEVPSVSGGVLWPDTTNKMFYLYGGEYNDAASVQPFENLWFFDTIYNTWNRTNPSASQSGIAWPAFGAGAVTEGGTAYYYGGYLSNKSTPNWSSSPLMLSSLISFDMDTQIWSNHTYDNTPRAEGVLQYLPASASGMLVYFGGVETVSNGRVQYIYPEPNELPHTATGKGWSSCNVVRGNSQMLIIGGAYGNKSYVQCDTPDHHGQHGLLLGQESVEVEPPKTQWWWRLWRDYNKYRVPDKIVSLVGGKYVLQV